MSYARGIFPPTPEGIKLLKSKFHQNVTISYKQPGICETTSGVKSYVGYVHLPPGTLDDSPPPADPICYVLKPETCRPEVCERVVDGTARVKDWPDGQVSEEL
ncbi:Carboxypeptidase S1 -like protein B [Colletotrichum tanaceti]|uniref:Carboxypeptidase S1-like protein B n=1 Tax=Colletotrichum tanaceti TaxID=1306861 RepID=A0A4U6XL64_9PEZI|nr:Carboxypeptidase S1 -like protein B [Colletotrichum tanaceti]